MKLAMPIVRNAFDEEVAISQVAEALGMGMMFGAVLGISIGSFQHRYWRGMFNGLALGVMIGPLFGLMSIFSMEAADHVFLASFGIAVLLLVWGAYIRLCTQSDLQHGDRETVASDETSNGDNSSTPFNATADQHRQNTSQVDQDDHVRSA